MKQEAESTIQTEQEHMHIEDFGGEFFLYAQQRVNTQEVEIWGSKRGLLHLCKIIEDLLIKGQDGSHYHLEEYSGLDGNVKLIIGQANSQSLQDKLVDKSQLAENVQSTELPIDIPEEVIAFINSGKPLEAMKVYLQISGFSLLTVKKVVDELSRVHRAGLQLKPIERSSSIA